jgi:hypothetical protein
MCQSAIEDTFCMIATPAQIDVPLRVDDHGKIRIGQTGMCQGLGNNLVKKIKMDLPLLLDG